MKEEGCWGFHSEGMMLKNMGEWIEDHCTFDNSIMDCKKSVYKMKIVKNMNINDAMIDERYHTLEGAV